MAKPKITRLSDPNNPYGGKKTPTRALTPAEKAKAAKRSKAGYAWPAPKTLKEKEPPTGPLGRARKRALDSQIDRATR